METFWLGIHHPHWLARVAVPTFVSHVQLRARRALPRAAATWALDSGAFSDVSKHGHHTMTPEGYIEAVRRYRDEIGRMAWAAPQDWMTEDFVLARTGKTLMEHQRLTTENLLTLRALAPELPIVPVLQGQRPEDYERHADDYEAAGIDLAREPLVGIGSVCRRQRMAEGIEIVHRLSRRAIRLHGFGVKLTGLRDAAHWLVSADSMAWSLDARRTPIRLEGCEHKACANCLRWALVWREKALRSIATPKQERLPL